MKLLKKDKKIIAYLRQDSRMQLTKLSRKTSIPVSTLFERINLLKTRQIIRPTIILNFTEIGFSLHVFVMIKTTGNNRSEVLNYLAKNHNTNSLWRINNHFDILAEMVFSDLKEFDEFLQELESRFTIRDVEFEYVVEEFAKEKFFSDPNTISLLDITNKEVCATQIEQEI